MLTKLAFRNVKRQTGNYLIYFITVSLTVAFMFSLDNAIYSQELLKRTEGAATFRAAMIVLTVIVALITAFVLGYATSFLLRFRKREFGTYLTLGMTRRNIRKMFMVETLILCMLALALGLVLGLFLYQGIMVLLSKMMNMKYEFAAYSLKGFILTVSCVVGMFLLSSLSSLRYLQKVSINDLIHGEKKVEKVSKHPYFFGFVMLLGFTGIVYSIYYMDAALKQTFFYDGESGNMFLAILLVCISVVLFHFGLAKSVVTLLLKNKKLCSKDTTIFTLRQLSGRLSSNSVILGILAFLITATVVGANMSYVQKVMSDVSFELAYPFDIKYNAVEGEETYHTREEIEEIINQYTTIEGSLDYRIYTRGTPEIYSYTRWYGDGFYGLDDLFIPESDFNRILKYLGIEPVDLQKEFLVIPTISVKQSLTTEFDGAEIKIGEEYYSYAGMRKDLPMLSYVYIITVVPDECMEEMNLGSTYITYDVKNNYDALALKKALSYQVTLDNGMSFMNCPYDIKEARKIETDASTAILILTEMYIAIVFFFMTMAILALKVLSGLGEDKGKYEVLSRLGCSDAGLHKTLLTQVGSFFLVPYIIPLLLNIPAAYICGLIMKYSGLNGFTHMVYTGSIIIAVSLTVLYGIYFYITYQIAKKRVL